MELRGRQAGFIAHVLQMRTGLKDGCWVLGDWVLSNVTPGSNRSVDPKGLPTPMLEPFPPRDTAVFIGQHPGLGGLDK